MDQKTMSVLFRVAPLDEEQKDAINEVSLAVRDLAEKLNNILPEVGEKQAALQSLYGALTAAKQAIEIHGVSHTQSPIIKVMQ